ncbi:MAG: hypothetical protein AAF532_01745 [Planctomycetota bacterium]
MNRRRAIVKLSSAVLLFGFAASAATAQNMPSGTLTEDSLGQLIASLGLQPKKSESRYDFRFKTTYEGEEWDLTMSSVLSRNGESIWVMAWLDEMPESSTEVPKAALLNLLSRNDEMGNGKFFAYIPSNRRFVLQRVVPNRGVSARAYAGVLKDLGATVRSEYGNWSVANWSRIPRDTRAAMADSKFGDTSRN